MNGQMEGDTRVHGMRIICMGKGIIHGKMEENIKANMLMIKNMEWVLIFERFYCFYLIFIKVCING